MSLPTKEEMEQKIREAEAELPELLLEADRWAKAEAEPSFSGWVRFHVRTAKRLLPVIQRDSGVPKDQFHGFMAGEVVLTSEQIDQLLRCIGIELPHRPDVKRLPLVS